MNNQADQEGLLTTQQAAEYFQVCERTVARMAARGELAAVRIGRCLRFRREDLDRFAAERASKASA